MSTKITSVAVENSTIDSSTVGATTPGTGQFTSLTADSSLNACGELVVNTSSATLTTAPAATDSSSKVPTTGWVQGLFAAMGFVASLGSNGYVKLPSFLGGLTLQWGTALGLGNNTPTTVNFNTAFAYEAFAVVANDNSSFATAGNPRTMGCTILSTSQFTIEASGSGASAFWFAVGY